MVYQYLVSYAYRVMVLGEEDEEGNRAYEEEFEGSARTYVDLTTKIDSPQKISDLENTLLVDCVTNNLREKYSPGTSFEISTMLTSATYLRKFKGKLGSRFPKNRDIPAMASNSPIPSNVNEKDIDENVELPEGE